MMNDNEISIAEVENILSEVLIPVTPSNQFVNDLKERLVSSYTKNRRKSQIMRYGIFGTAGFVGSIVVLVTSVRLVITLLGTVRIVRQV